MDTMYTASFETLLRRKVISYVVSPKMVQCILIVIMRDFEEQRTSPGPMGAACTVSLADCLKQGNGDPTAGM